MLPWSRHVALSPLARWCRFHVERCRRRFRHRALARVPGRCPVCARAVGFVAVAPDPRDGLLCLRCGSVPRERAVVIALAGFGVELARVVLHESSPSLGTWRFFRARCRGYVASCTFADVVIGRRVGVFTSVDLRHQPFAAQTFDVVVTQDLLQHVLEPFAAFAEIARTLRTDGVHVFTVPRDPAAPTRARVRNADAARGLELLVPAERHGEPGRAGSRVVTDWGNDLERLLTARVGLACQVLRVQASEAGVPEPIEVFAAHRG
jgi:SAM-dependent methyltransferase